MQPVDGTKLADTIRDRLVGHDDRHDRRESHHNDRTHNTADDA